jgi:hypothetical protein
MVLVLKVFLAFLVVFVVCIPLVFNSNGSTRWGVDEGLAIAGVIFFSYSFLALRGKLFKRRAGGYRVDFLDLLVVGAFPLYLLLIGNERTLTTMDNLASRNLPGVLLKTHSFDLSKLPEFRKNVTPYSAIKIKNEVLSTFPLGTPLLAVPYFFVARRLSGIAHKQYLYLWEKHFAAILVVASVCLFFAGLRRAFGERAAIGASICMALATTVFSCAGQAMWSFTGELFFICVALYFILTGENRSWRNAAAGFCMGFALLCRPTAVVPALVLAVVIFMSNKRTAAVFVAALGIAATAVAFFHQLIYGTPVGGYGLMNSQSGFWDARFLEGLAGVLFSPSRGWILYYPYLLLIPLFLHSYRRDRRLLHWSLAAATVLFVNTVLAALYAKWWGGYSLGPRLFTEASPFIAILTVPIWRRWKTFGWKSYAFAVLLMFSMMTQILGAYNESAFRWNNAMDVDTNPRAVWSWQDSQLGATWNLFWPNH